MRKRAPVSMLCEGGKGRKSFEWEASTGQLGREFWLKTSRKNRSWDTKEGDESFLEKVSRKCI